MQLTQPIQDKTTKSLRSNPVKTLYGVNYSFCYEGSHRYSYIFRVSEYSVTITSKQAKLTSNHGRSKIYKKSETFEYDIFGCNGFYSTKDIALKSFIESAEATKTTDRPPQKAMCLNSMIISAKGQLSQNPNGI